MPHLPVIDECFRVTLRWGGGLNPDVHNVFHVSSPTATPADVATALDGAWHNGQFGIVSNNYSVQTYLILPLDGSSTTTPFILSNDQQGGASGAAIYQASGVVSHYTAQRGSRGRGRSFLGPVAEDAQANGVLDATGKGLMQTAWGAFRAAVAGAGSDLVVASYQHADANLVTSETVQGYIATQRRRAKFLQ